MYGDWVNKCEYNFELEGRYFTPDVDRYYLTITDEDGENVFGSEGVEDKTYNDEGEDIQVEGWTFEGLRMDSTLQDFKLLEVVSVMASLNWMKLLMRVNYIVF